MTVLRDFPASLVALLAGVICASAGCRSPDREEGPTGAVSSPIVGGARSEEYPAVGALNIGNLQQCSAVLVAPNLVMTAAHCFENLYRAELVDKPKVWFFTGYPSVVDTYRAKHILVESGTECRFTRTGRDLALVVLERPVPGVEPLAIERGPHALHCQYLAVGYGTTMVRPGAVEGEDRRVVEPLCEPSDTRPLDSPAPSAGEGPGLIFVTRKSLSTCADEVVAGGYVASRSEAGSVCGGDSGSPLIDTRTKKLVGILSGSDIDEAGVDCTTGSRAVYTAVAVPENLAFIDEGLAAAAREPSEAEVPKNAPPESDGCRTASSSSLPWQALGGVLSALALVMRRRR